PGDAVHEHEHEACREHAAPRRDHGPDARQHLRQRAARLRGIFSHRRLMLPPLETLRARSRRTLRRDFEMKTPRWAVALLAAALWMTPARAQTDGTDPGSAMGAHGGHRNGNARAEAAAAAAILDRALPRVQANVAEPPNTPAMMRRRRSRRA